MQRYWLRWAIYGFTLPILAAAIFAGYLFISGDETAWQTFGMLLVFLAWPAMMVLTPAGALLGWIYGKVKRRNATTLQYIKDTNSLN